MTKGVLMLLGLAAGCATAAAPALFEYESRDDPSRGGVLLLFHNESHGTMCLSPSEWPNLGGKIHYGSKRVFLIVDGKRFPIRDFNTGSCIGGCRTYAARGTTLQGFIPYSEFGLPQELWSKPKSFEFSPRPYQCRHAIR